MGLARQFNDYWNRSFVFFLTFVSCPALPFLSEMPSSNSYLVNFLFPSKQETCIYTCILGAEHLPGDRRQDFCWTEGKRQQAQKPPHTHTYPRFNGTWSTFFVCIILSTVLWHCPQTTQDPCTLLFRSLHTRSTNWVISGVCVYLIGTIWSSMSWATLCLPSVLQGTLYQFPYILKRVIMSLLARQ